MNRKKGGGKRERERELEIVRGIELKVFVVYDDD